MQSIQLFIEGQRVDMFKDESVSITQSIQNVRDIAKIFAEFTKTFTLPASKPNNKIFKHYYNFSITDGFDAREKKSATIELNNLPFKKGKIKLEGVELQNRRPKSYKVTFFGNTVNLKDVIGEDKLNTLTALNSNNLVWNMANIKTKLQASISTNDIIAPLITHTDRLYYDGGDTSSQDTFNLFPHSGKHRGVIWNQLKYAIRVSKIVDAIESKYGLTFSMIFLQTQTMLMIIYLCGYTESLAHQHKL